MLTLVLLLILLLVAALCWWQGLWSALLTLINTIFAALVALNYFEPIATRLSNASPSYAYLWDVVVFWMLFAFSFAFLRVFTDLLSRKNVTFNIWVDRVGRTLVSLWIGWIFVGLVCLSLHIGPLPPHPLGSFQKTPTSGNFLGFAPGRQWLAFLHSRSRGALSRGSSRAAAFPQDAGMRVFDPRGQFIIKYYHRRVQFESKPGLRSN